MPGEQFVLGCWFLAMFSLGFIAGLLAAWWIAIEIKAARGRRPHL